MKRISLMFGVIFILVACSDNSRNSSKDIIDSDENRDESIVDCITIAQNTITEDTTWVKQDDEPGNPDYCISNDLEIKSLLTIEEGVIIQFESDTSLVISEYGGTVVASGTQTEPIIFTGASEIAGLWKGIIVESNDVRNKLSYVDVLYAGSENDTLFADSLKASVTIAASPTTGGVLALENVNIKDGTGDGLYCGYYGWPDNIYSKISNMDSVTFSNLTGAPVNLPISSVGDLDLSSSYDNNNGVKAVVVNGIDDNSGSAIDKSSEINLLKLYDGTGYQVSGSVIIYGGLTIEKGVYIEFTPDSSMTIEDGYLSASGTIEEPIVFTGTYIEEPSWRGVYFYSSNIQNQMEYVKLSYCGSSAINSIRLNEKACITLNAPYPDEGEFSIINSSIKNSGGHGIITNNTINLTQSGNTFENIVQEEITNL